MVPHDILSYINCNTKFVVYLITCQEYRVQYVGCTTTPLKVRIRRHLSDSHNPLALNISSVSRHFAQIHKGDITSFTFSGIESVSRHVRGNIGENAC